MSHVVLPARPVIYEINTWVWLDDLSRRAGETITLGNVPAAEWDALVPLGIDAVWLMGVWERSPMSRAVAFDNPDKMASFKEALPDLTPGDIIGSPYSVRRYEVDNWLGGREGLAAARAELARRDMALLLDFVPNHVAPDHPWTLEHPDYFIQGTKAHLKAAPADYIRVGKSVLARGRDPHFPPWPDVVQLNAFSVGLRRATIDTLLDLGSQCDGFRCDMAMLLTDDIFSKTWGAAAGQPLGEEFWPEVISAVRETYPKIRFVAEVYWDMEWALMKQGFDFCYDKQLYDRLVYDPAANVRQHLTADPDYQDQLVRFIENHDEPRAAATFDFDRERVAAVVALSLPGARLLHEGQLEGRMVKLPVFLARRPDEPVNGELYAFYRRLLPLLHLPALADGDWQLCAITGWSGNDTFQNLVAWSWQSSVQHCVIVANLSDSAAQGRIQSIWPKLSGQQWVFQDRLSGASFEHSGDEILNAGLYVDLPAWGYHFFELR